MNNRYSAKRQEVHQLSISQFLAALWRARMYSAWAQREKTKKGELAGWCKMPPRILWPKLWAPSKAMATTEHFFTLHYFLIRPRLGGKIMREMRAMRLWTREIHEESKQNGTATYWHKWTNQSTHLFATKATFIAVWKACSLVESRIRDWWCILHFPFLGWVLYLPL